MEEIHLEDVKLNEPLENYLVAGNGGILHSPGDVLSEEHTALMKKCRLSPLYIAKDGREIEQFQQKETFEKMPLNKVVEGMPLAAVYDEKGHLIVPEGTPADDMVVKNIAKRGITQVIVISKPPDLEDAVTRYAEESEKLASTLVLSEMNDLEEKLENSEPISHEDRSTVEQGKPPEEIKIDKDKALENAIRKENRDEKRSDTVKLEYRDTYLSITDATEELLSTMTQSTEQVNKVNIKDLTRALIDALIRDKELLLNCIYIPSEKYYLISHSVNSTVVSVNIATSLGMSLEQVMEVCFSSLVHDVGMLKVAQAIRDKEGQLGDAEMMEITRHPGYSLDILENVHGIPGVAAIVAYQVHERLDGSGYPKRRSAHSLHLYSKIVMIADTFCAMTSPRQHRQAFLPYTAMEKIIEMGSERKFDTKVLRAFLKSVGLYPIGSYVVLNNMNVGKVICLPDDRYDRPTVRLLFDLNKKAKMEDTVNLVENQELKVIKTIAGEKLNLDYSSGF